MLAERKEDYLFHMTEVNNTQIQNYLTVSCQFGSHLRFVCYWTHYLIFFLQMPDDRSSYVFWASDIKKKLKLDVTMANLYL